MADFSKFSMACVKGLRLFLTVLALYAPAAALLLLIRHALLQQGCPLAPSTAFTILWVFRYYRLIVQWIVWTFIPVIEYFNVHQRDDIHAAAQALARNVTIITPCVGPFDTASFKKCILSFIANNPRRIIIPVPSAAARRDAQQGLHLLGLEPCSDPADYGLIGGVPIRVVDANVANRRKQMVAALAHVIPTADPESDVVVLTDDHVYWPPTCLDGVMEPMAANRNVGLAGATFRVLRRAATTWLDALFNVLGCLYLERYNFGVVTTNPIDGAVYVLSGRSVFVRAKIVMDPDFQRHFVNERVFFGLFGPLNVDDDNCIARWVFRNGWEVRVQPRADCIIETDLGFYPKFLAQCLRWARSTWRTNPASLFTDRSAWYIQPWCVYAVHLTSLVNFALFYDAAMIVTLWLAVRQLEYPRIPMCALAAVIFLSKIIKTFNYWTRHPTDLVFLPAAIAFGYVHSLIKLWAMLTFWETSWSGRKGVQ